MVRKGTGGKQNKAKLQERPPTSAQPKATASSTAKKISAIPAPPTPIVVVTPELRVLTDIRTRAQALRKKPLSDLAREAEKREWQQVFKTELPTWSLFHQRCESAARALVAGDPEPFFREVLIFGPRALQQLLNTATVCDTIESWWLDNLIDATSAGRQHLERLHLSLCQSLRGPRRHDTDEERAAKKIARNPQDQRNYRIKQRKKK